MKDRVSTKILSNGATRYGVYDEDGELLRYEYIKLEDEPSTPGDLFNKANMLPDTIPSLLGLKMANPQVKDALNVLANVGNLHVWKRTQVLSEAVPAVPAGYTLGEVETDVVLASRSTSVSTAGTFYYYYGDAVTVESDGTVNAPSSNSWELLGRGYTAETILTGPVFVKGSLTAISSSSGKQVADVTSKGLVVFYIPSGETLSLVYKNDPSSSSAQMSYIIASKYQTVTGYPYTPEISAGTHVDYLTSTDPEAYKESSNGSDAYYTLGAAKNGKIINSSSSMAVGFSYSDTIRVDESGTVVLVSGNSTTLYSYKLNNTDIVKGKYIKLSTSNEDVCPTGVLYIPSDATFSTNEGLCVDKYQPVVGHAAVPANTTIEYLGQLGDAMRSEIVSYVGTGTYGESNPVSIEGTRKIKFIQYLGRLYSSNNYFYSAFTSSSTATNIMMADILTTSYVLSRGLGEYSTVYGKKSDDGKTFSWYGTGNYQNGLNEPNATYYFLVVYDF